MRIATVGWGSYTRPAGTELCHLAICQGMALRGHEIYLVYEEPGPLLDSWRSFTAGELKLPTTYKRDLGHPLRELSGVIATARAVRRWRPQCIYLNYPADAWLGWSCGIGTNAAVACHLHLPYLELGSRAFRFGCRRMDAFIAVSHSVAEGWAPVLGRRSRIEVVHNGVDTDRYRPDQSSDARKAAKEKLGIGHDLPVVLFAGRISPEKGLEVLVDALARLARAHEPVHLIVAGSSSDLAYESSLRRLTEGLGTTWLGWLDDLAPVYQLSDVVVMPSKWQEPFGCVVLEAMASGVPVVASRVGGIPEILSGSLAELLVPPGDAQTLATTLASVLHWRETQPDLGQRVRNHVEKKFGIDRTVEAVEAILEELAGCEDNRAGAPCSA